MRSLLRRSTPPGGGAGGRVLTGAIHHDPLLSVRQPTQRLPSMTGAPHRCSVASTSRVVSSACASGGYVSMGKTEPPDDTCQTATVRPRRAMLASRITSRLSGISPVVAGAASELRETAPPICHRAVLRHQGAGN